MASNLDRSLDEILKDKKGDARRNNKRAGPVGGVRKRSARIEQNKKKAATAAPTGPAKKAETKKDGNDTKIQVSNLPFDVNESMLREYFTNVVGPIKKCSLVYKANGTSAGVATIEFNKPGHANIAFDKFNGRLVDSRPMKVEIIVDPTKVPLANRISGPPKPAPKAAPKPAANKPKPVTAGGRASGSGAGGRNARGGRGGRGGRKGASGSGVKRASKTVEELDQEMADYYKGSENAAPAAAPQVDAAVMEDL
ncbi:hypothetical protein TWF481_005221 [Arthrobotrys musiformis]|uniref:RRM domain-containing protein n=1 Tax=Arthrobotrys musiformis TaxID=47236 RepID=A0AAV9WE06_9PEZI